MRILKSYGWLPDVPDRRDLLYKTIRRKLRLPKAVDLRAFCSPVEDQGALGSCTANALAGNLEFVDEKTPPSGYTDVSRLFIYYNERVLIHTVDSDSGAMLRDGIKTLSKQGVCSEKTLPYAIEQFTKKPSKACYDEAKKHRISSYHRILTHAERLACLSEGYPFVFGFTVYESFESQTVARTGVVPMPGKNERVMGGHAVLAVGFNEKARRFLVRNSWGVGWGMGGYFTMPYDYLDTLADDFWTIRK